METKVEKYVNDAISVKPVSNSGNALVSLEDNIKQLGEELQNTIEIIPEEPEDLSLTFASLQTKWLEGLDQNDYQELTNILNYFESLKDSTTDKKLYNELLIALDSLNLSKEDIEIDLSSTDGIKIRIIQALSNTSLVLSRVREAKKPIDTVNAKLNVLIQTLTGDENKSIYDDDLETIFQC